MAATTSMEKTKRKSKVKSKKPVHIAAPKMTSRRRARQVTTDFHRLTHEMDQIKRSSTLSKQEKEEKVREITKRIDAIGGRKAYQDASILSTNLHKTSRWVFQLLTQFGLRPAKKQPPLRVLEVGAINTQLLSCPWLNVRAIDLISRHEKIEQCDFFSIKPTGEYQVVVSSMVINCVPDPVHRGRMLTMYFEHLQPNGLLFLMLPLLCLRKSKFMTHQRFLEILQAVGFEIKCSKETPKISFFCLEKPSTNAPRHESLVGHFPLVQCAPADKANDFAVVF